MNKEEFLISLAEKTGTDKLGHGYIPLYAKHLPDQCRHFLEIGVEHGRSALMWDEFYGHEEVELNLVDLFINPEFKSQRWCWNRGFKTHRGDQSDIDFLYSINGNFEIICEDGSHRADHMQITFKHLFFNNMTHGGIYIVEDLKCCLDEHYWAPNVDQFEDTFLWVLKNYLKTGRLTNKYFDNHQGPIFEKVIKSVDLYEKEGIAFITKK